MILLDTNALITLMYGEVSNAGFSKNALMTMMDAEKLYVSVVSLWEIVIKMALGKISITDSIETIYEHCDELDIDILPISGNYLSRYLTIPLREDHKDPFDRLIIATAAFDGMSLVTSDEKMKGYGIEIIC